MKQAISKVFLKISLLFVTGFVLVACDVPAGGNPFAGPTKVALLVPAGSNDSNLNKLAADLEKSAQLALTDNPNARIQMTTYATAGNAQQAAAAATAAISEGANVIVGPLFGEAAIAVGSVAAGAGVNVLSFSNNSQVAGGNVFVLGETPETKANRLIAYAKQSGINSVLVLAPENSAGQIAADAVRKAANQNGVRFDGIGSYPFSPEGIAAAIPSIAARITENDTDAVVFTADSDAGLPLIAQMLPTSGVAQPDVRFLGITRWDIPPSTLALPGLSGGWFTLPDVPSSQQFNARFTNVYAQTPHPLAGLGYDGVAVVAQLKAAKQDTSKASLTNGSTYQGSKGLFRLLTDGTSDRAIAIAQANNGSFKILSGAASNFGTTGF